MNSETFDGKTIHIYLEQSKCLLVIELNLCISPLRKTWYKECTMFGGNIALA